MFFFQVLHGQKEVFSTHNNISEFIHGGPFVRNSNTSRNAHRMETISTAAVCMDQN